MKSEHLLKGLQHPQFQFDADVPISSMAVLLLLSDYGVGIGVDVHDSFSFELQKFHNLSVMQNLASIRKAGSYGGRKAGRDGGRKAGSYVGRRKARRDGRREATGGLLFDKMTFYSVQTVYSCLYLCSECRFYSQRSPA